MSRRWSPTPVTAQPSPRPRRASASKYTAWWERWNEPTLMCTTPRVRAPRPYVGTEARAAWWARGGPLGGAGAGAVWGPSGGWGGGDGGEGGPPAPPAKPAAADELGRLR